MANGDLPDVAIATESRVMVRCLGLIDWLFLFVVQARSGETEKEGGVQPCMLRHLYAVSDVVLSVLADAQAA